MTIYKRIGGEPAINAAVELFYEKMLADDRVNGFFVDVDMSKQSRMMRGFLTYAFGGPNNYTGQNMRLAHQRPVSNGLNDAHYDAVLEDLESALIELGVDPALIAEAIAVAESVRDDVLGRS